MKKFKTNFLLWSSFSLILFVMLWSLRWWECKGENFSPIFVFIDLLKANRFYDAFYFLIFLSLLLGIPAIAIAWVSQGLILIIKKPNKAATTDG